MLLLITGDHLRHNYLADSFSKVFSDFVWIIEKREDYLPQIDKCFNYEIQKLQKKHFEKRYDAELEFFHKKAGELAKKKAKKIFKIKYEDFSNGKLKKILKKINSNYLISYGCHKISDELLNIVKKHKWNIHGGLSPWYRGVATHFWPSYMLEPEYTGMTVHNLTKDIDAGDIIHQYVSDLNPKDGIHQNACRLVKNFSDSFPKLLNIKIKQKKNFLGTKHKTSGRIWTNKMWSPLHLKIIYDVYEDKINKYCLENKKIIKPIVKSILV